MALLEGRSNVGSVAGCIATRGGLMHSNVSTFAGQLRHFARSVDIVDDEIFERVRMLIYKYVRNELGAAYFEVTRDQLIEADPGLKMFWSSEDRDHLWRIHQTSGSPTNLITRVFAEQRALWVVGKDKKALNEADALEDLWSQSRDLQPYQAVAEVPIKTLVALPLRRRRQLGVYYFESSTYLGITDVAKAELQMLGDAIAILLELYETNRSQSMMTASAINDLQESLDAAKFPRLAKPQFFIAFSNRAKSDVVTVLSEVLHTFADRLEFTDWSRMSESGNVNAQIAKEIMRATFGVCYFSEPRSVESGDTPEYVDNLNVVFEAGMLHARTSDSATGGDAGGWIPLREVDSPPVPFDLAAERTLHIPRFGDGTLNQERLREMFSTRIERLLGDE
jgi:hypothetical protein